MVKRIVLLLLAGLLPCGIVSCKKSPKDQQAEKQAKFQAEQKAKAVKAYRELVQKFPESEYVDKAKERLRAIGPAATPAKKK
jgi:outer membrane protein assembly factor BamD (BamD/ComL family)